MPTHPARMRDSSSRQSRLGTLAFTFVALLFAVGLYYAASRKSRHLPLAHVGRPRAVGPTYELLHEAEVVWEVPARPRAVLFVAHGCSHGAVDFWPSTATCPTCIGLPEEVSITQTALSRGYAVVAVSSAARATHRCWTVPGWAGDSEEDDMVDVMRVREVLQTLLPREGLEQLPLYALGASSGGAFVLFLAMVHKLDGVCSQIMGVPPGMIREYLEGGKPYPPTLFVHMPRDTHLASIIEMDIKVLQSHGVRVHEVQVVAAPLEPTTLSTRSRGEISEEQSRAIYDVFKSHKMLDASGMLTANPRERNWRQALHDAGVPGVQEMRLEPDKSAVSEILNLLYAQHEIVGSTTLDMISWWESHRGGRHAG